MNFNIKNKVALITGGASGIGFQYAKELLNNGAKGVALADVDSQFGEEALEKIMIEFGDDKAIFVKTDVTSMKQFEEAIVATIKHFCNLDILINNAGIFSDVEWEKEISVNLNGTVHGMLLGMNKYLPKYKQGENALIVNIASTGGIDGMPYVPVYSATKHAILGLVKSWGVQDFYEETKVRVIGICPGATLTRMFANSSSNTLGLMHEKYMQKALPSEPVQESEFVAKEAIKIIKFALNGTVWVIQGGEPAYQYIFTDKSEMKNNILPR